MFPISKMFLETIVNRSFHRQKIFKFTLAVVKTNIVGTNQRVEHRKDWPR